MIYRIEPESEKKTITRSNHNISVECRNANKVIYGNNQCTSVSKRTV